MTPEDFINEIMPVPKNGFEEIKKHFEKVEFKKGEKLIKQGKTCKYLYFIEKGLGRSHFYNEKGKDITTWFFAENDVMTIVKSFFNKNRVNMKSNSWKTPLCIEFPIKSSVNFLTNILW